MNSAENIYILLHNLCDIAMNIKKAVYDMIQPAEKGCAASRIFDLVIMWLIFFSVVSVFIMTFPISERVMYWLTCIEKFTLVIFSAEYLLRLWTADYLYPENGKIMSRIKYITSGLAIIDLVAILPFLLPMLVPAGFIGVRAVRLVRLLRIMKLTRYSDALRSVGDVFRKKSREMLASMFFVSIILIIASLLIYYAEHDAQPKQFANAFSGLWWAVATLTTVGYGDIYPVTPLGRILGAFIAILGIGMVAIPTGILSAGFVEIIEQRNLFDHEEREKSEDEEKKYCPHCGKKL